MSNIVVPVLSVTIGLFFVFVGTIKLTPFISDEFYREMRKMFIKFARVFPLISITGWKPDAQIYRRVYGIVEVVCGLILALVPGKPPCETGPYHHNQDPRLDSKRITGRLQYSTSHHRRNPRWVLFFHVEGPLKQVANVLLFLLMCCSAYSHYAIKDGLDKMTPECIFGLLLACRFIVRLQIRSRESRSQHAHVSNYTNGLRTESTREPVAGGDVDAANKKTD